MPRLQPQRPQRVFRGSEFGRLMTMIGMCVVLVVIIKKASEPGMWNWLTSKPGQALEVVQKDGDNGKSAQVEPEKKQEAKSLSENRRGPSPLAMPGEQKGTVPLSADGSRIGSKPRVDAGTNTPKKIPAATGPTDEDQDEADAAIEEYDYVSDRTLYINQEDNPAYERLVRWVIYQPFERLWARATQRNASYAQFLAAPRDFREPGKIFSFNLHLRGQEIRRQDDVRQS